MFLVWTYFSQKYDDLWCWAGNSISLAFFSDMRLRELFSGYSKWTKGNFFCVVILDLNTSVRATLFASGSKYSNSNAAARWHSSKKELKRKFKRDNEMLVIGFKRDNKNKRVKVRVKMLI